MEQIICIYRKNNESLSTLENLALSLFPERPLDYMLYTDEGVDDIAFRKMKRDIIDSTRAAVIVSSAQVIGISPNDIMQELTWLKEHHILIVLGNIAASHTINPDFNAIILQTLIDAYQSLPGRNVTDIRVKVGRKKIGYPDNWDELYAAWENGQITAREFMEKADLKRGTFYHLAASYKAQLDSLSEQKQIG